MRIPPTATERALPAYRLPGLSLRAATFVVALASQHFADWDALTGRPKALSVVAALRLTLRRHATYQDLPEDFGIGRTTAWDYHQLMVAFLAEVLGAGDEDSLSALVTGRVCLIDGTLIPTFNWRHRLHGRLIAASQAFPGSWHDVHCFREAGWVDLVQQAGGASGDLGYEGEPDAVHTPLKKRFHVDLHDVERGLARIRVGAEWGVGHLKNWRIATTRYRSDLSRIDTDIHATIGRQRLNEQHADRRLSYDRIKAA